MQAVLLGLVTMSQLVTLKTGIDMDYMKNTRDSQYEAQSFSLGSMGTEEVRRE